MNLNYHEISPLISEGREDKNLGNASYDLSAGTIMDMNGIIHSDFYKIPPQGMVYVISKEKIKVPNHVIGFAHVKTSLTQKGIMATNIGIIDSGYEGYISTLLINFGEKEWVINVNSKCLRLTFNEISQLPPGKSRIGHEIKLSKDEYVSCRRSDTDNLDKKFLNMSSVSRKVLRKVVTYLLGFGAFFAALSFAVSVYFQHKSSAEKNLETIIKNYEAQTQTVKEENKSLEARINNLQTEIDKLK